MAYSYRKAITKHHQNYTLIGIVLIAAAVTLLLVSIGLLFFSLPLVSFWLAVVAALIGSTAFWSFRTALKSPTVLPTTLQVPRFEGKLKDGRVVIAYLELTFLCQHELPHAQDRIKSSLQRLMGSYLRKREDLSEDAYAEIDRLFQSEIPALSDELGLDELEIRTVDVAVQGGNA